MISVGYTTSVILFCVGLYCVLTRRDLFKITIGLGIMEGGIFLLLVTSAWVTGGVPPIFPAEGPMVNPLPHAFTLTAIVIGASDTALAMAFIIKLHRHCGTTRIDEIKELSG